MTTIKDKLWYDKIRGRRAALLWCISALAGGLIISIIGVPAIEKPGVGFIRFALPVGVILIYAYIGYRDVLKLTDQPALRIARIGQLADSLYYLGFLWTLWALIDSFVIHNLSMAEAAFRSFGYALVTTASGMFLRLALLQFSYSSEHQASMSEQAIEERIAQFSGCITKANEQIASVGGRMEGLAKNIGEASSQVNRQAQVLVKAIQAMAKKVREDSDKVIDGVDSAVKARIKTLDDRIAKVGTATEAGTQQITQRTETIRSTLTTHATNIGDLLRTNADEMTAATAQFAESFAMQLKKLSQSIHSVSEQIESIRVPQDAVESAVREQLTAVNLSLDASANRLRKEMGALGDAITSVREKMNGAKPSLIARLFRLRI